MSDERLDPARFLADLHEVFERARREADENRMAILSEMLASVLYKVSDADLMSAWQGTDWGVGDSEANTLWAEIERRHLDF